MQLRKPIARYWHRDPTQAFRVFPGFNQIDCFLRNILLVSGRSQESGQRTPGEAQGPACVAGWPRRIQRQGRQQARMHLLWRLAGHDLVLFALSRGECVGPNAMETPPPTVCLISLVFLRPNLTQEYLQQDRIWVCEFCLQYFKTEGLLARHMVGKMRRKKREVC